MERHVTLGYFGREAEGKVDLGNLMYTLHGKANLKYDKIRWDGGCVWCRVGATQLDQEAIARGGHLGVVESMHGKAPPREYAPASPQKRFQPSPSHAAAKPEWDAKVAEIRRVMMEQLAEVEREQAGRKALQGALPDEQELQARP